MKRENSFQNVWLFLRRNVRVIARKTAPIIPLILIASALLYPIIREQYLKEPRASQLELVSTAGAIFGDYSHDTMEDLEFLRSQIRSRKPAGRVAVRNLLDDSFHQLIESTPEYLQLRWIDAEGKEQLRWQREHDDIRRFSTGELTVKSHRYYFEESIKLRPGQFYVSELDLNRENGEIQVPFQPVLRIAQRLGTIEGLDLGILIINVSAIPTLNRLRLINHHSEPELLLLDEQGFWIIGESRLDDWNKDLRRTDPFFERYPETWERMQTEKSGEFYSRDRYWMYARFRLDNLAMDVPADKKGQQWWIVTHSGEETLLGLHLFSAMWGILIFSLGSITAFLLNARRVFQARKMAQLKESLVRTRGRLMRAERLASMGTLVTGLAHELNTPLGGARLLNSSMRSDLEVAPAEGRIDSIRPDLLHGLELVDSSLGRASSLVEAFKSLGPRNENVELSWFDVREMIESIVYSLQNDPLFTDHSIQIHCEEGHSIHAAQGPFVEVLRQLILNAAQHAFVLPGGIIEIHSMFTAQRCIITVNDNGQGIHPETLGRIFDPFFTTARGGGKTGIGLAIVEELTRGILMGRITVRSNRGTGTRFVLNLPIEADRPPRWSDAGRHLGADP